MSAAARLRTGGMTVWQRITGFLADTLLILAAAFGAAFCFYVPMEIPMAPGLLFFGICGLTLLFSLLTLLPWIARLLSLAACLAAWLFAAWHFQLELFRGAIVTGCQIAIKYAIGFPGLFTPPEMPYSLTAPRTIQCCTLFLLFVLVPVIQVLAWSIARMSRFTPALLVTALFLLVPLTITLTPPPLPLLAFGTSFGVLLLTARQGRYDRGHTAKLRLLLLPVTAAFLIGAVLLLAGSEAERAQWAEQARIRWTTGLLGQGRAIQLPPAAVPEDLAGRTASVPGVLRYPGFIALRVQSDLPAPLYLHGFSAAAYTGEGWQPFEGTALAALDAAGTGALLIGGDTMQQSGAQPHTFTAETITADPTYLYTPYLLAPDTALPGGASYVQDAYILAGGAAEITGRAYAAPRAGASLAALDNSIAYRQFVSTYYTSLPDSLAQKLRTLAKEAGIPTVQEAGEPAVIAAVTAYIRGAAVYDTAPGVTPEGADLVEYFLTENRRGYCVHFASAGTAMLRALGVPARYAQGFVVRPEDFEADGWAIVPDRRAHAWAEVYDSALGWYPLEMTPGQGLSDSALYTVGEQADDDADSSSAADTSSGSTSSAIDQTPSQAGTENGGAPSEEGTPPGEKQAAGFLHILRYPLYMLCGLLALAGALAVRRKTVLYLRTKRFAKQDCAGAAALFAYYQSLPVPKNDAEEAVLRELTLKARFGREGLSQEEQETLYSLVTQCAQQCEKEATGIRRLLHRWWYVYY